MADEEKNLQPEIELEISVGEESEGLSQKEEVQPEEEQPMTKEPSALQQMKEQISEDDDAPIG